VKTSGSRAFVQGSGFAQKLSVPQFRAACKNGGKLNGLMNLYVHALLTQISQSAVCNGFHPIEARLARWLLMTHDRMQADEFQITQSFLSKMVGVRREAVNKAVGALQNRELIAYRRGNLTVKDRKGLENASCDCYALIKKEGERY
ncbi:MAG: helix-turn-helix domain-containing protein, partial [Acidobacteriota bacterium]